MSLLSQEILKVGVLTFRKQLQKPQQANSSHYILRFQLVFKEHLVDFTILGLTFLHTLVKCKQIFIIFRSSFCVFFIFVFVWLLHLFNLLANIQLCRKSSEPTFLWFCLLNLNLVDFFIFTLPLSYFVDHCKFCIFVADELFCVVKLFL
jgi:hypothetical protein